MIAAPSFSLSMGGFLRSDPGRLQEWLVSGRRSLPAFCIAAILAGAGTFGAAMGIWREATQALYTGIKLPLVILLTTLGNGMLNGMLAPLLGLNTTFRQSLILVLMTFAATSIILGALSPVILFAVWNTPPLVAGTTLATPEYGFLQLVLAGSVALAGIWGNVRLVPLLHRLTGSFAAARNVLLAWLAVNLLLGSQVAWVLRPFIRDPSRPVEFIGHEYFHGSFFETVFNALCKLASV